MPADLLPVNLKTVMVGGDKGLWFTEPEAPNDLKKMCLCLNLMFFRVHLEENFNLILNNMWRGVDHYIYGLIGLQTCLLTAFLWEELLRLGQR